MNANEPIGAVRAIALKTAVGGPMREVASATALSGGGLAGSADASVDRGVTLLSEPQWRDVMHGLKAELPWHARRANILLDVPSMGELIGGRIRIGPVELLVTQETKPCGQMEAALHGLAAALGPDCRGGVCCRVMLGGEIRVGDALTLVAAPAF